MYSALVKECHLCHHACLLQSGHKCFSSPIKFAACWLVHISTIYVTNSHRDNGVLSLQYKVIGFNFVMHATRKLIIPGSIEASGKRSALLSGEVFFIKYSQLIPVQSYFEKVSRESSPALANVSKL